MNKIRTIATILLLILVLSKSFAIETVKSVDSILYKSYITKNKDLALVLIKDLNNEKPSLENTYLLLKAQYALLYFNTCYNTDKALHKAYISKAKANADKLIENKKYLTEVYVIKACLYGIEIGISPMKGIFLGSSIDGCITKAVNINKLYPYAWATKGRSLVSKPSVFGGDVKQGIKLFDLSITLFENNKTKGSWEYLDTYLQMAIAYLNINSKEKAKEYLNKVLKIEPEFKSAKWFLMNRCN
jgi:tetratricopeptide (TPR) repeat protein